MTDPGMVQAHPTGYGQLIKSNRNFRFLWLGQIVSLLGDWFNLIASAALVASLTESGLAVGSLFVVRMLAPFLVSPLAGVVADRYSRKRILIVADILRAGTAMAFLLVQTAGDIWLLYSLTALQLGISGFFFPARTALLPDLVSRQELGTANALGSVTWSVMLAMGAALGGLVSGAFGIYPAFVIDAATFLVSAILLTKVLPGPKEDLSDSKRDLVSAAHQYLKGLSYLAKHPPVLATVLHKAALGLLFGATFDIVQIAIAEDVFVIGIQGGVGLGLMFGLTGVGTGLGPIFCRRFTGDRDPLLRRSITYGYLIGGLGLAACAPLASFATVLGGTLLRGIGGGIIWVFSTQLLLSLVPRGFRGRVFATELAIFTLASAIGSGGIGYLLDTFLGISGVIWLMACCTLLPAALWALWLKQGRYSA